MKIKILLRGSLTKYFEGERERIVEVPEGSTCDEALQVAGLNYREIPRFGFVAVNNHRVMIDSELKDGDELKAYSKISGG